MPTASSATPAITPITMPAMAPPDKDVDELGEGEVGFLVGPLDVVDEVCEVECVCVAAIKVPGLKDQVLADGAAWLNDEYVSLSTLLLMLVSVSCAEFQQTLIWPFVAVQTSLFGQCQDIVSQPCREGEHTLRLNSTMYCLHCHRRVYYHHWHKGM